MPEPVMEGGNVAVILDENEYMKGVEENRFCVLGKLTMQRGAEAITTLTLRDKLSEIWGLSRFKVILIERGFFHVTLYSMSYQSKVMNHGAVHLKSGLFRVSQWMRDFNPLFQRQTNVQV